jgi:hypothetical protein
MPAILRQTQQPSALGQSLYGGAAPEQPMALRDVTTPYYTKYGVVSRTYDNTSFCQNRRIHTVFAHTVLRFEFCARSAKFFRLLKL